MNRLIIIVISLLISANVMSQHYLLLSLDNYLSENGFQERTKDAVNFLKKKAIANDTDGMYYYSIMLRGVCYKKRNAVKLKYSIYDPKESMRYLKLAAMNNSSKAQLQYAKYLAFGDGIKQNKYLAKAYFSKSSALNNTDAMIYEAECYLLGFGCMQDSVQAYKCYKRMYHNVGYSRNKDVYEEPIDSIYQNAENFFNEGDLKNAITKIRSAAVPIDFLLMDYTNCPSLMYAP